MLFIKFIRVSISGHRQYNGFLDIEVSVEDGSLKNDKRKSISIDIGAVMT